MKNQAEPMTPAPKGKSHTRLSSGWGWGSQGVTRAIGRSWNLEELEESVAWAGIMEGALQGRSRLVLFMLLLGVEPRVPH